MKKMRFAVVSTDGIHVDDHFGKAKRFLIFDLEETLNLVDNRSTEALSIGDPGHAFDPDRFDRVASKLKDCSKIYVTRIGDVPAAKLKTMGIEPVVYSGAIADIAH